MDTSFLKATKLQIGLLDDKNWTTWRYKLVIALRELGVLDIVEGNVSRPILASNATPEQKAVHDTQLAQTSRWTADSPCQTPTLYVDNEGAVKLAHNPPYEYHRRTKHIRLRHYYVRECVNNGILRVKQVPAEEQLADMLTKPLFKPRLELLSQKIGQAL